jgi:hypothetical protein
LERLIMAKAIEGAAMLAGAFALNVGLFVATDGAATPFLMALDGALYAGGVSMEAAAIASALTSNRGMNITTRQAAGFRQLIYGQQRVGGVPIYQSTTGSHLDQYNYIIVLAGHPCDSIQNLYLDGRQVFWEVGSAGNSTTASGVNFGGNANSNTYYGPNGVAYNFGGSVYCEAYLGNQIDAPNTEPNGGFSTGLQANDPTWGPNSEGQYPWVAGCTYVYLKLEYNTNLFPSMPEIRFTVNGKNTIYDPRTGTTGFSSNWALIVADVITDPVFGLGDNTVNQAQLIAAANVCDEQVELAAGGTEYRYSCNYHYDTSTSPGDVLSTMMTGGGGGRLSRIGGEWYIWPAYYQGAEWNFDQNAMTGSFTYNEYRKQRDLINCVNGTYIAPTYPYNVEGNLYDANGYYNGQMQNNFPFAFQPTNYPQYAADTLHGYAANQYLTEDLGIVLPKELALSTVLSVSEAQRTAKIALMRNRQQGSGSFAMNLSAWGMQPLDVMQFSFPPFGWTEKVFEVTGIDWQVSDGGGTPSVGCTVHVQETNPTVYEWSTVEELTVYDVPATPTQIPGIPAPPTEMVLTSGPSTALVALDGTITPRIMVTWNTPLDISVIQIWIQYCLSDSTTWINSGLVSVDLNMAYITGVVSGQSYNVRIASVRANGAISPWEEINGFSVATTLVVLGIIPLDPGSLIAEAYDDGTAAIEVFGFTALIGNASVPVLPAGPVWIYNLQQTTLYYVYYIDPNFTGGAITPIATTNSSDFLNKQGYFLIDSIVTPYAGPSTGGNGGAANTTRYAPTSYNDAGTRATSNPTYAYDGNSSTAAVVSSFYQYVNPRNGLSSSTLGNCTWSGFPNFVTQGAMNLYVTASFSGTADSASGTITGIVGPVSTDMLGSGVTFTSLNGTLNTFSIPIQEGTNLSTISLQATANSGGGSGGTATAALSVYEIYAQ